MTSMNNLALMLSDVFNQMQQQMAMAMPGAGKGKKGKQKGRANEHRRNAGTTERADEKAWAG